MNDNGDDDSEEELRAIIDGTNKVLGVLEKAGDPHTAMQILASAASCILCFGMHSEEQAEGEFRLFVDAINRSILKAKKNKMTIWPVGGPH